MLNALTLALPLAVRASAALELTSIVPFDAWTEPFPDTLNAPCADASSTQSAQPETTVSVLVTVGVAVDVGVALIVTVGVAVGVQPSWPSSSPPPSPEPECWLPV
jgi:hypothetical protein